MRFFFCALCAALCYAVRIHFESVCRVAFNSSPAFFTLLLLHAVVSFIFRTRVVVLGVVLQGEHIFETFIDALI